MKPMIVATDREHLKTLIRQEVILNGNECNLNHIDVSNVSHMTYLFAYSKFNGNISNWDVSNVVDMSYMFTGSKFSGDISNWKPYNLNSLTGMFMISETNVPYWAMIEGKEERNAAILERELSEDLDNKNNVSKKFKI